ncbi:MAG: hypothetical protein AAF215_32715, partial [Cyanobacteria bacterium P01_A01_bin.123]
GFWLLPFNPASGVDGQSQTWGLCCHSTTGRKGLSPLSDISYQGSRPCPPSPELVSEERVALKSCL